jgi:HSP20 family protein
MISLREAMDRLFAESFVGPVARSRPNGVSALALDLFEGEDEITVSASIPGVKPEDIDISVTGDVLTIKGESLEEKEEEEGCYHMRERRFGSYQRSIQLPTLVQSDKAKAEFVHGVLTLSLPKAEEAKSKSIKIKAK